jgi:hypothetical protein
LRGVKRRAGVKGHNSLLSDLYHNSRIGSRERQEEFAAAMMQDVGLPGAADNFLQDYAEFTLFDREPLRVKEVGFHGYSVSALGPISSE